MPRPLFSITGLWTSDVLRIYFFVDSLLRLKLKLPSSILFPLDTLPDI